MGIEVQIALAVIGIQQGVEARQDQKKAAREQKKQNRAENVRQKRRQLRELRLQQGETTNVAAQIGAQGSSAEVGAQSSAVSQFGTNVGFLAQSEQRAANVSKSQQSAADSLFIAGAAKEGG